MTEVAARRKPAAASDPLLLPLALTVITVLLMVAFQTLQLVRGREAISDTRAGQETAHTEARRVRLQFESIAKGTAQLAASGNPNAAAIITALEGAGVSINLDQP